jgi:hypothetical protein
MPDVPQNNAAASTVSLPSLIFGEAVVKFALAGQTIPGTQKKCPTSVLDTTINWSELSEAELKYFSSKPADIKTVSDFLTGQGFSVFSAGRNSISIGAPAEKYNELFGVVLEAEPSEEESSQQELNAIWAKKGPVKSAVITIDSTLAIFNTVKDLLKGVILSQPTHLNTDPSPTPPAISEAEKTQGVISVEDLPTLLGRTDDSANWDGRGVDIVIIDTGFYPHPYFEKFLDAGQTLAQKVKIISTEAVKQKETQVWGTQTDRLQQLASDNLTEYQRIKRLANDLNNIRTNLSQIQPNQKNTVFSKASEFIHDLKLIDKTNAVDQLNQIIINAADGLTQKELDNAKGLLRQESVNLMNAIQDIKKKKAEEKKLREKTQLLEANLSLGENADGQADPNGHGTLMAACALELANKAKITLYKRHFEITSDLSIWQDIERTYLNGNKANKPVVISCSYGKNTGKILHQDLIASIAKNVPVFFSSGNKKGAKAIKPVNLFATISNVISVGGAFIQDKRTRKGTEKEVIPSTTTKAGFANEKRIPDLCGWCCPAGEKYLIAPVDPNTPKGKKNYNGNIGWRILNGGSSAATAQVAGLAALVLQRRASQKIRLRDDTVEIIKATMVLSGKLLKNNGAFAFNITLEDLEAVFTNPIDYKDGIYLINIDQAIQNIDDGEGNSGKWKAYLKGMDDRNRLMKTLYRSKKVKNPLPNYVYYTN